MKWSLACSIVLSAGMSASADLPRVSGPGQLVLPKRVARISPDLKIIGPWLDYREGGIAQPPCGETLTYDAMDAGGDYGVDCGLPGERYYFGPSYCNMFTADDMRVGPGTEGVFSERVKFMWFWNPAVGGIPEESCLVALFTAEDMSATCVLPAFDNMYDGVLYEFGELPQSNGYYLTDVDNLCDLGLGHQMPIDGSGGFIQVFAQGETSTGVVLATCAQPMLWGTKHPDNNTPGNSAFYSGPNHWDDDSPSDGEFTENECHDYTDIADCPNPLSTSIAFYYEESDACDGFTCGDANCDGTFDGADIDPFFLAVGDPDGWRRQFPSCELICVADINGDDSVDGGDIDAFFAALDLGSCPP